MSTTCPDASLGQAVDSVYLVRLRLTDRQEPSSGILRDELIQAVADQFDDAWETLLRAASRALLRAASQVHELMFARVVQILVRPLPIGSFAILRSARVAAMVEAN